MTTRYWVLGGEYRNCRFDEVVYYTDGKAERAVGQYMGRLVKRRRCSLGQGPVENRAHPRIASCVMT